MTPLDPIESPDQAPAGTPPHSAPSTAARSEDQLLTEAQKAFDQGDYKSATRLAQKAQDGASAAVSAEAQALLERMRPPPLTKYLLFLSFMLLTFVTLAAYRH